MGIRTKYKLCAKRNVIEMQRHRCRSKFPMNAPAITDIAMTQRRRFGANIPIIVFAIVNVSGTQHRAFYDDYSMHVFDIINALMVQPWAIKSATPTALKHSIRNMNCVILR